MSREKKFTPGPWSREMDFKAYKRYDSERDGLVMVELGENCGSRFVKYDVEWDTNANLIAAAPELLEACENLLEMARQTIKDAGGCDHQVGICMCGEISWMDDASAAIKKAYGETK